MMQGKVLDLTVAVNMVAAISVCLSIAFWLFALVRYMWSSEKHDRAAVLSLSAFAAQLGLVAVAIFVGPRIARYFGMILLLGTAALLSILNIIWARLSTTATGSRMRVATLLWVAGIILAVSTPQQ